MGEVSWRPGRAARYCAALRFPSDLAWTFGLVRSRASSKSSHSWHSGRVLVGDNAAGWQESRGKLDLGTYIHPLPNRPKAAEQAAGVYERTKFDKSASLLTYHRQYHTALMTRVFPWPKLDPTPGSGAMPSLGLPSA